MSAPLASDSLDINTIELKKTALIFRAANHKLRQQMLQLLHKQGRMNVTQMFVRLRLEQSCVSQHLGILRKASLVTTVREGKQIYYSVNYEKLQQLHIVAGDLANNE